MSKDSNISSSKDKKIIMPVSSILSIVKITLENLHELGGVNRKIQVKKVDILNSDTLQCYFCPYSQNSNDIKTEIASIMGAFNGLFKENRFESAEFKHYAVRAIDNCGKELLFAISTKSTAELLGQGNAIDWLKSTLFQENTDDYRLGLAKRIISEIENTLRHVINDVLTKKYGDGWWNNTMNNKLGRKIGDIYKNQYGVETFDGTVLVKYTYLFDLKKIVLTEWPHFRHLFSSKMNFENSVNILNQIRREEAHNRTITEEHVKELDKIYDELMLKLASIYTDVFPTYLVDNWKLKIKGIMSNYYTPVYDGTELTHEEDTMLKLTKITISILNIIQYLKDIEEKLQTVITPIQKKELHIELINHFAKYRELHELQIENLEMGKISETEETIKKIKEHKLRMDDFALKFLLSEG